MAAAAAAVRRRGRGSCWRLGWGLGRAQRARSHCCAPPHLPFLLPTLLTLQRGWRRLARRLVLAALAAVELEPPPDRPADGLVPGAERVQYYWEAGTVLTPVLALLEPAAVRLRPRA